MRRAKAAKSRVVRACRRRGRPVRVVRRVRLSRTKELRFDSMTMQMQVRFE
jgi:hypothetical protein